MIHNMVCTCLPCNALRKCSPTNWNSFRKLLHRTFILLQFQRDSISAIPVQAGGGGRVRGTPWLQIGRNKYLCWTTGFMKRDSTTVICMCFVRAQQEENLIRQGGCSQSPLLAVPPSPHRKVWKAEHHVVRVWGQFLQKDITSTSWPCNSFQTQ